MEGAEAGAARSSLKPSNVGAWSAASHTDDCQRNPGLLFRRTGTTARSMACCRPLFLHFEVKGESYGPHH